MREITITTVLNGYIVHVGCQTVVFSDIESLASTLIRYSQHPTKVEEEFLQNALPETKQTPEESLSATVPPEEPRGPRETRTRRAAMQAQAEQAERVNLNQR